MKTFLKFTTFLKAWNIAKAIPIILLVSILSLSPLFLKGQNGDPPPPPGEHGQNGNQPPGGGAPVGEGLIVLLLLSTGYGMKKRLSKKN